MTRLYDCILYNDEIELLTIRLQLLADVVDHFIVVWSKDTFTGSPKSGELELPSELVDFPEDKVRVVIIDKLIGNGAWEKESYSRNRMMDGLHDASNEDLIMVSDVDEIPRPSVLTELRSNSQLSSTRVLGLDYFNFKFNYQLVHGLQCVWAGPVVCRFEEFSTPQELRDVRWSALEDKGMLIENAGWHFSYLTDKSDVSEKLRSFSHQESDIQDRKDDVIDLINERHGFHDHIHAGSVWAVVSIADLGSQPLENLVSQYPSLVWPEHADDQEEVRSAIRGTIHRLHNYERRSVIRWCTTREIGSELGRRFRNRIGRFLRLST